MNLIDLLEMLKPALDDGCRFEIYSDTGTVCIDLNTGAKSGCVLKLEEGITFAYRRYNRKDKVESFDDILELVWDCCHRRSFFDEAWIRVFDENELSDPRGDL